MKMKTLSGCAGITIVVVALSLAAGSALAAKRDVIADAEGICGGPISNGNLQAACDLQFKTNGEQILGNGCDFQRGNGDNGFVNYQLRNCDQNEEALLRKASSAVLSVNDFVNKGKAGQAATAGLYLCTYAESFMTLQGVGKLVSTEDLAADAQDIASALGFPCP